MRTSVRERLKRLARIIVNGVKYDDLGSESLDDMLRAATELTDRDIIVLKTVNEQQHKVTVYSLESVDGTIKFPREVWQVLDQDKFITPSNQMEIRSSLSRLQAVGFGSEIQTMESSWRPRFLVSPQGEKFLNYLEEIESD
jgi:predicted transcriptional regulator